MDNNYEYFYKKKTSIFRKVLTLTDSKFKLAPEILKFIREDKNLYKRKPLKILDIGTGNGELVNLLVKSLIVNTPEIELFICDPSIEMFEEAKNKLTESFKEFPNFKLHCETGGLGKNGSPPKTYTNMDIVICSHIFYWIENWSIAVDQIMASCSENGHVYLVLHGDSSENFSVRESIYHAVEENRKKPLDKASLMKKILIDKNIDYNSVLVNSEFNIPIISFKDKDNILSSKGLSKDHKFEAIMILEHMTRKQWINLNHSERETLFKILENCKEDDKYRIPLPEEIIYLNKIKLALSN